MNRQCTSCNNEFPCTEAFFYKHPHGKDGFESRCKSCLKEYQRKLNFVNRKVDIDIPEGYKKCGHCKELLPKTQDYFKLEQGKYYWGACNTCRNINRRERDKVYYENNRDKVRETQKSYRNKNKDSIKEWDKNYYKTPERRFNHHMNSAKQRFIPWDLTMEEFMEHWQKDCYYCADSIQYIGLDRLDPSKGYEVDNVVSCCKKCNFAKHLMSHDEFIEKCHKIVETANSRKRFKLVENK